METAKLKRKIKSLIKIFWDYTIQDDVRIYRLKHTPVQIKRSLTKAAEKKYGSLPIEPKKLVFDDYMGSGYGGNSKYVTEELLDRRKDLDIVWIVDDIEKHKAEFPPGIRLVEYKTQQALKEYATAAIWICNYHLIAYFNMGLQKRPGQCYIQLWHGSLGIKRIENDFDSLTERKNWNYLAQKNSRNTDYWISNSSFETQIYQRAFWSVHTVLEYGHPRNDLFFKGDSRQTQEKVKRALGIDESEKIVLYVPTFREDDHFPENKLDVDSLRDALRERFSGSWRVVVRLHPRMKGIIENVCRGSSDAIVMADEYPDIQELLLASQVAITDYSSGIFDFLLTGRPGFLYAPDLSAYNNERGFYYPLENTPFPMAENNNQLADQIRKFDENGYREKISSFLEGKGCIEDGRAAERVCDLIEEILFKEEGRNDDKESTL